MVFFCLLNQVINHGVSIQLLEHFKREIEDFFKLSLEEKKKLWQEEDNHEGFGQLFVVSEEQKLDWSDMFYVTTLPTTLRKSKLFQLLPPNLRSLSLSLSLEHFFIVDQLLSFFSREFWKLQKKSSQD